MDLICRHISLNFEVNNLSIEAKKLLKTGKSKEEIARILSEKRRDLGVKYKNNQLELH
jgi:DNA-binding CsgD family transcriptional regulator